ncbi:ABC transporter permease [Desulfovibrio inopinatus]|uniref:ABC transporter permease n=1 Tax=Desulfovibrio inopinatus TaxID=102109 RepID=UPI00040A1BA8|nr:ABC transporter permease [Desulfovibrio inopinatus]
MFALRKRKRENALRYGGLAVVPIALALSFGICAVLLAIQGQSPIRAFTVLWEGSLGASWALADALLKSVPIFLCSLGVAITFRMQIWNIGAEGQFALGTIGATWAALSFSHWPAYMLLPWMFLCAAVAGALWALLAAGLRIALNVSEIISTLMLNYIAILFLEYLVYGVWKDPQSFGFPMTREFSPAALIGMIGDSRQHWGLVIAPILGVVLWAFLRFTRTGFEIKASGSGVRVAAYAKLPYPFLVALVMAVSGAYAGIAGCIETSAVVGRLQPSIMAGYGYTAIVVAWLARLNPLGIALTSFLLACLRVGVENMQLEMQIPAAFGSVMEGVILLSVLAGQFFYSFRFERLRRAGKSHGEHA